MVFRKTPPAIIRKSLVILAAKVARISSKQFMGPSYLLFIDEKREPLEYNVCSFGINEPEELMNLWN